MNIFVVSDDPIKCAQCLDDRRLNKMISETFQILCTAASLNGIEETPFRPTHKNHPCVRWTASCSGNYAWVLSLAKALTLEWHRRTGKIHGSAIKCLSFVHHSQSCIAEGDKTSFVNCSMYKDIIDIYEAYRLTLIYKWRNSKYMPRWTNAEPPEWTNV